MANAAQQEQAEITCVMIPIAGSPLLLPNVTVAEIVAWRRIKEQPDLPPWCAGWLGWRGETLPVMHFPALNGTVDAGKPTGRCILVMNRTRHRQGTPFYGLLADGLPRLVHLASGDMQNHKAPLGPAEVAAVKVGTEIAVIPNLTAIEEALRSLPQGGAGSA